MDQNNAIAIGIRLRESWMQILKAAETLRTPMDSSIEEKGYQAFITKDALYLQIPVDYLDQSTDLLLIASSFLKGKNLLNLNLDYEIHLFAPVYDLPESFVPHKLFFMWGKDHTTYYRLLVKIIEREEGENNNGPE